MNDKKLSHDSGKFYYYDKTTTHKSTTYDNNNNNNTPTLKSTTYDNNNNNTPNSKKRKLERIGGGFDIIEERNGVIKFAPKQNISFYQFVKNVHEKRMLQFFEGVMEVLRKKSIVDYHFKITETSRSFVANVFYGKPNGEGPLSVSQCMSCDLSCPLSLGVHGEENSTDSVARDGDVAPEDTVLTSKHTNIPFGDQQLVRCWFDAKGRIMYLVTPVKHVKSMTELSDTQLVALWRTAVELLESEQIPKFDCMILNHGQYMNHAHLHLKIRMTSSYFFKNRINWSNVKQQQWAALVTYNTPKMEKILKNYPKHNNVFVSNVNHVELGLPSLYTELGKYGNIIKIIPHKNPEFLTVQFETKEEAARCICEGYGKFIGNYFPQIQWARNYY